MNAKVSYLSPSSQQPKLDEILLTARAFLLEWQQGNLKPLPALYESIERHAKFLNSATERMATQALRMEAELHASGMEDIVDAIEDIGEDPELLLIAQETTNKVLSNLTLQIRGIKNASIDLSGLSAPDASRDEARLLRQQMELETTSAVLKAEIDAESSKIEALHTALKALEAIDVEIKFDGQVPTPEQLAALAVPGGQIALLSEAAAQALKDLEKTLGKLSSDFNYSRLQAERRQLALRLRTLQQNLTANGRNLAVCRQQLKALEHVPVLVAQRKACLIALNVLALALESFFNLLKNAPGKRIEDLRAIDALFKVLLAYQRSMIKQISNAF
ncbi:MULTISPECIES: alpha-xenorhabdolysin family binary toxin subunit B [Pseudomonas]|uniref:Alpha-xenorhabdolysin family binary toxin subunit B n=1 Tax=Pseudomonas putida TaxID=303 RepID=A0A1B2F6V5_PSEPU|nr:MULTISPECIES: alpha-xenorhabdolysin family binary toxin subunit B [Pseudomonas]ANY87957.1 hypothetical protein IEC33019_2410 [Pseudomonas putida]MCL8307034.1 alpha-xenorhabdolysin family binary toxin subunit B [Pseudomonas putida]